MDKDLFIGKLFFKYKTEVLSELEKFIPKQKQCKNKESQNKCRNNVNNFINLYDGDNTNHILTKLKLKEYSFYRDRIGLEEIDYDKVKKIYKSLGQFKYLNQINKGEKYIEIMDSKTKEKIEDTKNLDQKDIFIKISIVIQTEPSSIRGI